MKKFIAVLAGILMLAAVTLAGCSESNETVVLRVCNWEEYIDLGDWDEAIELESGEIFGENSMVEDFEEWFKDTYGYNVKVEYSTFGTNEDLYNRLSLGDEYDLVCPSDYMLMKLISEGNFVEYSPEFWDADTEENYYARFVSRYIDGAEGEGIFNQVFGNGTADDIWHAKAACYMWGTTGLVYNPEEVDEEDVSTWAILLNDKYSRRVTIKDNVRDAYFSTLGIINSDILRGELSDGERSDILNNTDGQSIKAAEDVLKQIKENVYSFETDSGKADMVTGKVLANLQWSGDAVYIMDEADGDDTELWYSVPDECTNLWFDGWIMLKNGVERDSRKKTAAEAFVNFLSRPDNAVRNMYYIGYTSSIAEKTVFEYLEYNYGADGDAEELYEYDLGYFFGDGYSLMVDPAELGFDNGEINRGRQLFAQYPPDNVIARSVVMLDFGEKLSDINRMWINVRCPDLLDISPVTVAVVAAIIAVIAAAVLLYVFRYKIFIRNKPRKGYKKEEI